MGQSNRRRTNNTMVKRKRTNNDIQRLSNANPTKFMTSDYPPLVS